MKEVEFKDRVPTYPGRVTLTPVPGQENVYDMTRSDEPVELGTALDKATFDSMVKSRLTGRYYIPNVATATISNQDITVNPIPTSGWLNATKTTANVNGYEIYGTAASSQSELITAAFDGNPNTFWRGLNNEINYIGFKLPSALKATKIKAKFSFTSGDTNTAKIQASNNWTSWTDVSGSFSVGRGTETEITINATQPYYYYRVLLDIYLDTGIDCYGMELSGYNVATYANAFTLNGVALAWTQGQRLTIQTPTDFNTIGISSNTLNGIRINTILLPGRRYELIYEGSAFVAKEV